MPTDDGADLTNAELAELYRRLAGLANRLLALFGRADGHYRTLPLAGGWTRFRDFPAPPAGGTFHAQWTRHGGARTRP